MTIVDKAKEVQEKIIAACKRSGRDPQDVQLLPVSKNHPAADIAELYKAGWNNFGENYVQELAKKHDELPADINWYMIGHLQRNKVKYIADYVTMIQSVDSLKLMNMIEKEGRKHDRIIPILIEVNVGEEESKFDGYYNYSDKELYMDGKIYNQYFLRLVFNLNRRSFEETKGILISYSTYDNLIKVSNNYNNNFVNFNKNEFNKIINFIKFSLNTKDKSVL